MQYQIPELDIRRMADAHPCVNETDTVRDVEHWRDGTAAEHGTVIGKLGHAGAHKPNLRFDRTGFWVGTVCTTCKVIKIPVRNSAVEGHPPRDKELPADDSAPQGKPLTGSYLAAIRSAQRSAGPIFFRLAVEGFAAAGLGRVLQHERRRRRSCRHSVPCRSSAQ